MPKVSVLVPVYGVEKYIERCARSLFEQTLDDIEYLFIDDCTPDKSIEILKWVLDEYPLRKQQVIIHRMEQNSGQAAVRKWGILNATGEYIIHCDSDDWVDVTMYEKLYNKAIEEDADMVVCDYYEGNPNNYLRKSQKPIHDSKLLISGFMNEQVHWNCWCILIRQTIYSNSINYPSDNMGEDMAMTLQLAYYCQTISYVAEPLYFYCLNPNSIIRQVTYKQIESKVLQLYNNVKIVSRFYENHRLSDLYEQEINRLKFRVLMLLNPNTYNKEGRALWKKLYPELTLWNVLRLSHVTNYQKVVYTLAALGLYPTFRKIKFILGHK